MRWRRILERHLIVNPDGNRKELIQTRAAEMPEEPLYQKWISRARGAAFRERKTRFIFLIISLLNVFLFAGALLWFSAQYQTNDDAAMNMYAAGKGLGHPPSQFLLFQHFLIGLVLKFLYRDLPGIPWYGALMYTYLFLSSVIIGYVISRLSPRLSTVISWVVLFGLFYLQVIVSLQFTICSGYLAIAGVLLLYSTLHKPYASGKINLCILIIASGLLILAGLIRFYSLLLVLLSMIPLYAYLLVTRFAITLRRLLPILCCAVLTSVLLNRAQLAYYERSPGWEQFYRYNHVRAEFIDRHKIVWDESTQPLFQQIGWSRNDLEMLKSWFYLDPNVYSFQNLSFISKRTSLLPKAKVAWDKLFANLKYSLTSYTGMATLLLCALLLIWGARITRGFAVLALLWYVTLFAGVTLVERHLPLRVWLVMLCGLFVTELVLWCHIREEPAGQSPAPNQRIGKAILSFFVYALYAACFCGEVHATNKLSNACRRYQKIFRADLTRLRPRPNQLFVTWGGDFPYQTLQLPTHAGPVAPKMQFLGLGVGNQEPFVQNRLRSLGINDLYQSFYIRDNIFLICQEDKKALLVQYIQEHYQTKVEVETVFKGRTFTVRKVRKIM